MKANLPNTQLFTALSFFLPMVNPVFIILISHGDHSGATKQQWLCPTDNIMINWPEEELGFGSRIF